MAEVYSKRVFIAGMNGHNERRGEKMTVTEREGVVKFNLGTAGHLQTGRHSRCRIQIYK